MKRKVAIIDDDDDVREVVTYALEEDGFHVMPFVNPEEALARFEESRDYPGFILLDYFMPKMNGITFIHKIRADYQDTLGKIPCALSTANGSIMDELPVDVMEIRKPMDLDHLLDLVRENCL
jgi:two-component system nitrogen regulation response regulator GlnG